MKTYHRFGSFLQLLQLVVHPLTVIAFVSWYYLVFAIVIHWLFACGDSFICRSSFRFVNRFGNIRWYDGI
jgi:hypothetical protein